MNICRISFYDDFVCAQGACPETCCRAWSILVDDDTYRRYRREKGLLGLRLFFAVRGREDRLLNASRIRCHFYRKDGLCELQKTKGLSFLPLVCRVFPRKRINLGLFAEEYLDLACPEAARLFLANTNDLTLRVTQGDVTYASHMDNDDDVFLEALIASRKRLISILADGEEAVPVRDVADGEGTVPVRDEAVGGAGQKAREADGIAELNARLVNIHRLAARWQTNAARNGDIFAEAETEPDAETPDALFPLRIRELNEWMNTVVYADDLRRRLPFLYRLSRLYFRRFDALNEQSGQRRLDELVRTFADSGLFDMKKYAAYAAYYLYRYYTETFTDYSFLKRVRGMALHTSLVFLLDALWADEYGELPEAEQARIIAVYEKRVFHSAAAAQKI